MRTFIVFILLLLCQQTTVNGQQNMCTSDAYPQTADCCPLSVDYYESQIRKADSLYKNYLPQSNFEEVKASMEFFDSIRNEKLAIRNYGRRKAIPNSTFLIPNYQCAKAHYYHAVGLTEKDDIVGACKHYLIALEIMEEMMANEKRLKAKGNKYSIDNPDDYEKIRFVYLIHTRLGESFYEAISCEMSLLNYKKAFIYKDSSAFLPASETSISILLSAFTISSNSLPSTLSFSNKSFAT